MLDNEGVKVIMMVCHTYKPLGNHKTSKCYVKRYLQDKYKGWLQHDEDK